MKPGSAHFNRPRLTVLSNKQGQGLVSTYMEEENIKCFNICNHFQPGATIQKILQLNDNLK